MAILFCLLGILVIFSGCRKTEKETIASYEQFNSPDCTVASWYSTITERIIRDNFPLAKTAEMNGVPNLIIGLKANKWDTVLTSKVIYDNFQGKEGLKTLETPFEKAYFSFLFSNDAKGKALREEMNAFIDHAEESGLYELLEEAWLVENPPGRKTGHGSEDPNAPELTAAIEYQSPPFGYVGSDGECTGFDVDFLDCFCKEYGYRLNTVGMPFSMLIAGDSSGRFDIAGGGIQVEKEPDQSKVFSKNYFESPHLLVIKGEDETVGFSDRIKNSLYRTFVEDRRWEMFLDGIWTTLLIVLASVLIGSVCGFYLYRINMKKIRVLNLLTKIAATVLNITPVVVLLMIFYYIVFSGIKISGVTVSIIVLSLIMMVSVFELMDTSVKTVDMGQREAAIALGCSPRQAFYKVIFPQALRHFLPVYKGEIVGIIKFSSIVGYIAVQDLTKVSDIIQARTYDAFSSLFAAAVFYALFAILAICFVNFLFRITDPRKKRRRQITGTLQVTDGRGEEL